MIKTNLSNKLYVLAYHAVHDKENFERQVKFLKRKFDIISLQELEEFFYAGGRLPARPLLLTFDDGDFSLYTKAFPVLKENKVPAAIFVITDLIDTQKPFWWDELEYYLGKAAGNKKAWEMKEWPNKKREEFLGDLRNSAEKEEMSYPQLTQKQLKDLQEGGVSIANHSHTHPMFDKCSVLELEKEMEKSGNFLNKIGLTPDVFAYPNGNFSPEAEKVLQKKGVRMAFLFDHKINKGKTSPLRISRLVVNDTTPLWKVQFILSGWHSKILPLTRGLGKLLKN